MCQIEGDMIYDVEWQFIAEGSSIALPIEKSGTVWTSNSTQGIGTMSVISEFRIDSWPSENDGTYFCEVNQGSGQDSALVNGGEGLFIYQYSCLFHVCSFRDASVIDTKLCFFLLIYVEGA